MTDTNANQIAIIVPMAPVPEARANQFAFIVPLNETPPKAAGAYVNQIALISVDREFQIPLHLHGWLVRSIQGFPYYIEDDGL